MQPFRPPLRPISMTLYVRGALHPPARGLLVAVAAIAALGPLLAACSSTASPGKAAARAPVAVPAPTAANGPAYGSGNFAISSQGAARHLTLGKPVPLPPSQSIIYTANLALRARDVTTAVNLATGIVIGAGGYVAAEQENLQPGGGTPQVRLTFKIPVGAYHPTLARLAALGHQLAFSQNAVDVTQQVADVNSRVTSAQAAIRQLRTLLARAGSVSALLSVQDQINSQQADLEALLAQQRALARETSYATVSVLVLGHHVAFAHHKKTTSHTFVTGLSSGWHAFGSAVSWLLVALGTILPFAVLLAVLAVIGWTGRHRLVRRRRPPAPTPPAEAA